MKTYDTQEEFLKDCNKNIFEIEDDIELNFDLYYPKLKIKCKNLKANYIKVWNIIANNTKARNIKAWNINAIDITTNNIKANNIKARNIDAMDIIANDIKANNLSACDIFANDILANDLTADNIDVINIIANNIKVSGKLTAHNIAISSINNIDAGFLDVYSINKEEVESKTELSNQSNNQ